MVKGRENGAGLRLHRGDKETTTGDPLPDSWRGDATIFSSLLERIGREVEPWTLRAATEALDALVVQLFADCGGDDVSTTTWDRVVLLATLLGYRELLSALAGRPQALAARLARRPKSSGGE